MQTSWLHREWCAQDGGEDAMLRVEKERFDYTKIEPSDEPVTLAEAKDFARIDVSDDDALVTSLIESARQAVEQYTGRAFMQQTWEATLDFLPGAAEFCLMPRPLITVTHVRSYYEDGTYDELSVQDDLIIDYPNACIGVKTTAPVMGGDRRKKNFSIQYDAGYASSDVDDVPEWAKTAIKQLVAHWYENREAVAVGAIASRIPAQLQLLLDQHVVPVVF